VGINVQLTRLSTTNIILFSLLEWLARLRESLERGWREDILMAEHPTAITPPSTVGSKWYLDMLFSSMSCTFSPGGLFISIPVWEISREKHSRKIHFWTVFFADCFLTRPSLDQAIIYICCCSRCFLYSE